MEATIPTAAQVQQALYLTMMRDSSRPRELKPHLGLKIFFLFLTKAAVRPHAWQAGAGKNSAPVLPLCTLSNQGFPFRGGVKTTVRLRVSACLGSALQRPPVEVFLECLTMWPAVECHLGTRLACTGEEMGSGSALLCSVSV